MRYALLALGVIMVLIGGVWILQGVGALGGSVMTGQSMWAIIGTIVGIVGLVVLALAARLIARYRPR